MKKKISINFFFILLIPLIMIFVSCDSNNIDTYYNLIITGTIYYEGEQTVLLQQSDYSSNKTLFKDNINESDISLAGVLDGKNVKSVNFLNENEVSLTLDGSLDTNTASSDETGTITVSYKALENGANGCVLVNVDFEPKMAVTYSFTNTFNKKYVSEFSLPYGYFIEENINENNIDVPVDDGITVNMYLTEDNDLRIEAIGFEPFEYNGVKYDYPPAKINANVTTFNKELYVNIGQTNIIGYKLN